MPAVATAIAEGRLSMDHLEVPHVDDGPTSQFNGRIRCPTHNRHRDKRDPGQPLPQRRVDRLDAIRARLRWQLEHYTDADWAEHERERRAENAADHEAS